MANEVIYAGDPVNESGLTLEAKVYTLAGVQQGADVALTEVGSTAIYRGNMPTASAGTYIIYIQNTANTITYGIDPAFAWDGSAEVTIEELHSDIAALNDVTAAAVADAVWDESTSGHTTAGTFGEQVSTDLDAILVDTNSLNDTKIPDTISLANIASNVLAETVEGSYSLVESMRLQNAALLGKLSGAATTTITIRDIADTKDRIVATVDSDGNRSALTLTES